MPERDYVPLFALLRRRLSDDEVAQLAEDLATHSSSEADSAAIHSAIEHVISETPSEADVSRVLQQLESAGWEPPTREHV